VGEERKPQLLDILSKSRELGLLGPGELAAHIEHARGFAAAVQALRLPAPTKVLDLGSGGGIPGLVLLELWPEAHLSLLDSAARRCEFLSWALESLGAGERAEVLCGRAEELAHQGPLRGAFDLVVARSFGPPAVLAECAAGFLAPGGHLVVSEPPEATLEERWPPQALSELGFEPAQGVVDGSHYAVLRLREPCPDRYPRRVGVPAKRPLF
jgi:16S rRNA (guanine527-N7)-methyltransferase